MVLHLWFVGGVGMDRLRRWADDGRGVPEGQIG